MSKKGSGAHYPDDEAQARFEATLHAALNSPPRPLKDVPRQRPQSKREALKAAKSSIV
jgi:hypothetical protein